jgi:hypothetical protein
MQTTKTGETIFKFNSLGAARDFTEHAIRRCWTIILGDDELFWVVTFRHAAKLVSQGYEEALY